MVHGLPKLRGQFFLLESGLLGPSNKITIIVAPAFVETFVIAAQLVEPVACNSDTTVEAIAPRSVRDYVFCGGKQGEEVLGKFCRCIIVGIEIANDLRVARRWARFLALAMWKNCGSCVRA